MDHFPRPTLARTLSNDLQGLSFFGDASNGIFLSAPEGTGKSAFLLSDLKPELEARGIRVLYCDLWASTGSDAASMITNTIITALSGALAEFSQAKLAASQDNVMARNGEIDAPRVGKVDSLTLADALEALAGLEQSPIALIIDEAQQALATSSGALTMFALKSARDQLNQRGKINLMLVLVGSDREKLQLLVRTPSAPFFGSIVQTMPFLGRDFVAHLGALIEQQRPVRRQVDLEKIQLAFTMFGCRPKLFTAAVGEVLNPLNCSSLRFEDSLLRASTQCAMDDERHAAQEISGIHSRS